MAQCGDWAASHMGRNAKGVFVKETFVEMVAKAGKAKNTAVAKKVAVVKKVAVAKKVAVVKVAMTKVVAGKEVMSKVVAAAWMMGLVHLSLMTHISLDIQY